MSDSDSFINVKDWMKSVEQVSLVRYMFKSLLHGSAARYCSNLAINLLTSGVYYKVIHT